MIILKIQKSVEAQHIKDIQSLEAEVFVQKMLIDLGKKVNLTLSLSNTFHCENVYLKYNLEHTD